MPWATIPWNLSLLGVFLVDVGRVHIAGHHREQLDVPPHQRALDGGDLADLDLVKRAVLDRRLHVQCPMSAVVSVITARRVAARPAIRVA